MSSAMHFSRVLERRAPERWRSGAEPFCRSAVGAPLQEASPERCRSAAPEKGRSAPGALALQLRSSKQLYSCKNFALRAAYFDF